MNYCTSSDGGCGIWSQRMHKKIRSFFPTNFIVSTSSHIHRRERMSPCTPPKCKIISIVIICVWAKQRNELFVFHRQHIYQTFHHISARTFRISFFCISFFTFFSPSFSINFHFIFMTLYERYGTTAICIYLCKQRRSEASEKCSYRLNWEENKFSICVEHEAPKQPYAARCASSAT